MAGLNKDDAGLYGGNAGLRNGAAGLYSGAAGLQAGSSGPPVLQNVTVPFGAYTGRQSGTVLLKNLGLIASGPTPAFWRTGTITKTGAGGAAADLLSSCTTNTANATARSPASQLGVTGTLANNLLATTYVIPVTAVGANGVDSNTVNLTYTVVANSFNRGDLATGNQSDSKERLLAQDLSMGGLTMLISVGANYIEPHWTPLLWNLQEINSHTGRVTIQYADATRPSQIRGIDLMSCQRMDLYGLGIGGGVNHKIFIRQTSTNVDDVHCYNFYPLGATFADVSPTTPSSHAAINFTANVNNCSVEDSSFQWMGRCVSISGATGCTNNKVLNSTFRYHYSDALSIGTSTSTEIRGNMFVSPMRPNINQSGSPDHVDSMQLSDLATITTLIVKSNMSIQADGTAAAIGLQGGQTAATGVLFANNIVMGRSVTAAALGAMSVISTVRDQTYFFTGSGLIGNSEVNANDNLYNGGTAQSVRATGGSGANVMTRVFNTGSLSLDASWADTNSVHLARTYPNAPQFPYSTTPGVPQSPTDFQPTSASMYGGRVSFDGSGGTPGVGVDTYDYSGHLNYSNARERLGNYDATVNPDGTDYANMTVAQIKTRVLLILTPKTGGSLDLGAGVSIGAVSLAGALKTA